MKSQTLIEAARAKINLTLHVGPSGEDGYHPLHSIVVFADVGDALSGVPSREFALETQGPFADDLPPDEDNLVLRTAQAFKASNKLSMALHYTLTKNLPVASGIGGGSADTAAALRMLGWANHVSWDEHAHDFIAFGADVPVCYLSQTSIMKGIGEDIMPLPGLGRLAAVLINPGVSVPTANVFDKFDHVGVSSNFEANMGNLLDMAKAGRNDLQPIAVFMHPVIGDVIEALEQSRGCNLARMSGSGATCFGLFNTMKSARSAANAIQSAHKDWWCVATWLGDES